MTGWKDQTIGSYHLVEEIGRGGSAVVYRAYQAQLERWVAVKLLEVKGSGGKQFLHHFRHEARAIAALRHPNILNIYDYGEDKGCAYIVMEYVEGGALSRRMADAPLPLLDALNLVTPIGDALAYAHSQGIVHQDVRPSNVLLIRPDWPLLMDFGLAKAVAPRPRGTLSGTGSMGFYLAPEQLTDQEVDSRADMYSLGLVLYELLTGKLPFQPPSGAPADRVMMRLHEPPISPSTLNATLAGPAETLLLKMLERDPGMRYATMEALVADLRQLVERSRRMGTPIAEPKTTPMITTRLSVQPAMQGPQLFIATSGVALPIPALDAVQIGRRNPAASQSPDLDLEPFGAGSAGVSRQHARLLHQAEGWFLEDLQSTNGSYVNEVRLLPRRPVKLRSGDLVRFGQMTLVFEE
ncbi:MAG TPA: FHA domain-containing serine/threonine-protein kinase [Anaerolineae bacterium]|nr:FHA domain-containing serine/threonine-protein kinase [Anaerolineae bacterium]